MYSRHEISWDEHLDWWERVGKSTNQRYFMYERSGAPVGIVALTSIDLDNMNACWAFYASPNAPKGTGSRMELLVLEHAFSEMGLHKLYCEVLDFNVPVIRLHEKFGFKLEGVFCEHHLYNGIYINIHRLAITMAEWMKIRETMIAKVAKLSVR